MATKRISKKVVKNVTAAEFEEALAGYAAKDARAMKLAAEMDEKITKIREKYDPEMRELMDDMEDHREVIEVYSSEHYETLFSKKKSYETTHGTIGYRTGTPKLKTLSKFTWAKVLDNLKAYLPSYVRKVEEPAKDRLLTDRELPEVKANLSKVGLQVVQDESFFIELKKEDALVSA